MVTHSEFQQDYKIAILILVRYTGAGDPPSSWVRAQRAFVETYIYNVLKDPRSVSIAVSQTVGGNPVTGYVWPAGVDNVSAYDPALLRTHKVFWVDLEVTFRGVLPI
jgi:hypothetical protein